MSMMVLGFFMLFFSFAFIIVFPESEHSAFPYPLGIPGIALIILGAALNLASRNRNAPGENRGPAS